MSKTKKISVNAFEKVMNETYIPEETFEWHGIEVTVKKTLSLEDMLEFVNSVVNTCFSDKKEYRPEAKDFAIKTCILEKYASFTMPKNIQLQYELIYCTDAVSTVVSHINHTQLQELMEAIDDRIEKRAQANIEALHMQMSQLCAAFENIRQQLETAFSGISNGEIKDVVNAISNSTFDEEKLVQAYMTHKTHDKATAE